MERTAIEAIQSVSDQIRRSNETISENSRALLDNTEENRAEINRRFSLVYVLGAVLMVAVATLVFLRYQDEKVRTERSVLSEKQRRCEAELTANAIGRARTQPVADPALMSRLREDITASYLQPNEALRVEVLVRVRDTVRQILGQVPQDDPILHVRELCYTGTPSDDPVHDPNTTPSSVPPTTR